MNPWLVVVVVVVVVEVCGDDVVRSVTLQLKQTNFIDICYIAMSFNENSSLDLTSYIEICI